MINSPTFIKGESLGYVEIRYSQILTYLNALVSYTELESGTIALSSLGAFLIFVMKPKIV